jgi:hypothetical protein
MKTLALVLAIAFLAGAQETLTNEAVVKMLKGGLGEDLIVSTIQSRPGTYNLSSLSDKVLAAMLAKGSSAPETSPAEPTPAPGDGKLPYVIAHIHVPSPGNHARDFGSMFVTADGIEFRGAEHSFKWRKDEIAGIHNTSSTAHTSFNLLKVDKTSEAISIQMKSQSQKFVFVACSDTDCADPLFPYIRKPLPTDLYDIVLRQLGRFE